MVGVGVGALLIECMSGGDYGGGFIELDDLQGFCCLFVSFMLGFHIILGILCYFSGVMK